MSGIEDDTYLNKLKEVVLNGHDNTEVVLLEIEPEKQNTKIDFYYCHRDLEIPIICVTEVIKHGDHLFYINDAGEEKQIKRIYNRVIFDELDLRKDLTLQFSFEENLDVEWAGHPNWYTRISKFILPYLKGKYFIESRLLSEFEEIPEDLENYVLKPLFSFSGTGVVFNVKKSDIGNVKDKDLFILQKKVAYAPVIQSPDGKVKVEVRVLALWPEGDENPTLVGNLTRLSRGEMIGVKFNKDKDWVGGSIGLFVYLTFLFRIFKATVFDYKAYGSLSQLLLLIPILGLLLSGQLLVTKIGWVLFAFVIGSTYNKKRYIQRRNVF